MAMSSTSSSKRRSLCRAVASLTFFVFACSANGEPIAIQCPAEVEVEQTAKGDAGWEAIAEKARVPLDRVTFYSGHPSEKASLTPDDPESEDSSDRWTFVRAPNEDIWLSCVYAGSGAALARRLEASIKRCQVTYGPAGGARRTVTKIVCEK